MFDFDINEIPLVNEPLLNRQCFMSCCLSNSYNKTKSTTSRSRFLLLRQCSGIDAKSGTLVLCKFLAYWWVVK